MAIGDVKIPWQPSEWEVEWPDPQPDPPVEPSEPWTRRGLQPDPETGP